MGPKNIVMDYFWLECGADEKPTDDRKVVCLTCHQCVVGIYLYHYISIENIAILYLSLPPSPTTVNHKVSNLH